MGDNPLAADLDHVLEHTRALWEDLRGERIFITGGTGFFGCWLLESFLWANERLGLKSSAVVLTRRPEALRIKAPHLAANPALTLQVGDVRNFAFPSGTFSHVIHAASESSSNLRSNQLVEMLDTILIGTRRSLDFALQAGTQKFLFTSSGAVYGKQPFDQPAMQEKREISLPCVERLDLNNIYQMGKYFSELQCSMFAQLYHLTITVARCFAFVGPYFPLSAQFAIGNFILNGMKGEPIEIKGDGTPYRSYLYAADLAIWLWTILLAGKPGQIYNVGSDDSVTIFDLANRIADNFQPRPQVHIFYPSVEQKNPNWYVPSINKARSELGLQPWVPLDESIRKTIQWYSQPTKR